MGQYTPVSVAAIPQLTPLKALYTSVTVVAHVFIIKAGGKHTSLLTHEQRRLMPASEIPAWAYGSKIFMLGQMLYASIVWSLKFNMLFFYRRVTRGLWVEKLVVPAIGLVACTGIAILLIFTCTCRPFSKLWQVWPDPGGKCTLAHPKVSLAAQKRVLLNTPCCRQTTACRKTTSSSSPS